MYQKYRDVAEFRMIYIREAHASNGQRPNHISREKDISEHESFEQRCKTAEMLINDEELTIPCLIDSMDNKTDAAYSAKPDRAFLVDTDGKLVVAGARGPRGFSPALNDIEKWLSEFKKSSESKDGGSSKKKAEGSSKKSDEGSSKKSDEGSSKKSDEGSSK